MKKLIYYPLLLLLLISCSKDDDENENSLPADMDFRQEMRRFVQDISAYAKKINPAFVVIPQNGVELVSSNGEHAGTPVLSYINAIDGIGQEDLFYGYNNDDEATPEADNQWLRGFLDMARKNNVNILVTDYCATHSKMDDSYAKNSAAAYISFAADHRELDHIPAYPNPVNGENADSINDLSSIKNFLYLIAPDNEYANAQAFVDAVKNSNYDAIIMDFFFDGQPYSAAQIAQLRQKANGGKRLLICYMSIGEAENYRYYWKSDWKPGNPAFIYKENPDWPGNYTVRYWDTDWQKIIFGTDDSYLKKILDAGFDGVYLDIIDAYERFE
jgi:cysteinyl-tRNA synthetase